MNQLPNRHLAFLATLGSLTILFLGVAGYNLWAMPEQATTRHLQVIPSTARDIPGTLNLSVTETGMAVITMADLRQYNFPANELSTESVALTRDGDPVPFYVSDDAGDEQRLYFFAQAVTNTLEAPAVYQLQPGVGLAMSQHNAAPTAPGSNHGLRQAIWEENRTFLPETGSPDPWYGRLLLARHSLNIPLNPIQPNGSGDLYIQLWSNTDHDAYPDHHVQISLNGRDLLSWKWDGIRQETIHLTIPDKQLNPYGDNTLTISVPGDTGAVGETIYLDWVRLEYEADLSAADGQFWFSSAGDNVQINNAPVNLRLFETTDPANPLALTKVQQTGEMATFAGSGPGSGYYALTPNQAIRPSFFTTPPAPTTPLRQAEQGADYIAIYADRPGMAAALRPLTDYRQAQGLRVTAVPLSQIVAEFGYGRPSPQAIREFLAYAAANWQPPAPRFLLLAGDASYDTHNWLDGINANLLPTPYIHSEQNGYISSDVWYTQFGTDRLTPQMAVGRFPAQNAAQLGEMVAKTIAFEQDGGLWQHDALFVADDEPFFDQYTQQLGANLEANQFTVYALYMSQDETIHHEIIGALTNGVGLVNYAGDGTGLMWGDEAVFQSGDAGLLANNGRPAIFTTFTCNNGAFSDPFTDSLGETLLNIEDGGAVAVVGPSACGADSSLPPFIERFYAQLLAAQTVGEALTQAKIRAIHDPDLQDAISMFHLLGDPALRLVPSTP